MPTKTITVCAHCGKKTCDGGIWKIVQIINLKSQENTTAKSKISTGCTLQWFGRNKEFRKYKVGHLIVKEFLNWSDPARVTLEKVQM